MRRDLTAVLAFTLLVLTAQATYGELTVGYYPVKGSMLGWVEVKVVVCEDRDPSRPVNGTVTFHILFKPGGLRVDTEPIPVDEHGVASYRAFNLLNSEVEVVAVAVDGRGRTASAAFKAQLSPLPLVAYALAVGSALTLLLGVRWARRG